MEDIISKLLADDKINQVYIIKIVPHEKSHK